MNTAMKSNGMLGHADAVAALGQVFHMLPPGDVGAQPQESSISALGQVFRSLPARAARAAPVVTSQFVNVRVILRPRTGGGFQVLTQGTTTRANLVRAHQYLTPPPGPNTIPAGYVIVGMPAYNDVYVFPGQEQEVLRLLGLRFIYRDIEVSETPLPPRPRAVGPQTYRAPQRSMLYGDPFAWLGVPHDGTLGQCATFEDCFADPVCNDCWNSRWELCDPARGGDMAPYASVEDCARERTRTECMQAPLCGTGTRQCDDSNASKDAQGNCVCQQGYVKIGGSGLAVRCARQGAPAPKCPATCPATEECTDPVFGCEPKCPAGQTRDPGTRLCRVPSTAAGGGRRSGGSAGLILLAVAALAGIGLALAGRGGA